MTPVTVLKATKDEWYGNLYVGEQAYCYVGFAYDEYEYKTYYVWASGGDDFGLVKHFESETEGWNCFLQLIGKEYLSTEDCRELGLVGDI